MQWLIILLLGPALSFAAPKITGVQRNEHTLAWTEVFDDGLVSYKSCDVNLDQSKVIGALTAQENSDRPEGFYQRHLQHLKSVDANRSRIRLDRSGRIKVWSEGSTSEGGEILILRRSTGDVTAIRILAAPNSPSLVISNRAKIDEIVNLLQTRFIFGGAPTIKDDGFYDRYMWATLDDVPIP